MGFNDALRIYSKSDGGYLLWAAFGKCIVTLLLLVRWPGEEVISVAGCKDRSDSDHRLPCRFNKNGLSKSFTSRIVLSPRQPINIYNKKPNPCLLLIFNPHHHPLEDVGHRKMPIFSLIWISKWIGADSFFERLPGFAKKRAGMIHTMQISYRSPLEDVAPPPLVVNCLCTHATGMCFCIPSVAGREQGKETGNLTFWL